MTGLGETGGGPVDLRETLRRGGRELPLAIVAILLLSSAVDILPGTSLISIGQVQLTLARLLILIGLVVVVATEGFRRDMFRSGLAIPIALLLVVGLISSHDFGTYPRYRALVEGVAVFYLTLAVMRTRPDAAQAIAWAGFVALSVAALTAVMQVSQGQLTGFYRHGCTPVTKPFGPAPAGSLTRAIGTFANPNVLAGYLLLLLPLGALAVAFGRRNRAALPTLLIGLGIGYLADIFTFSRAAVLLSILLVGLAIWLSEVAYRRYLILVVLALGVALAFLVGSCGSDATAGYGRSEEWRLTLQVIGHHPVFGVGLGNLKYALKHLNALSTAQHAHNLFLTWWAEAGTGALIAWVWIAVGLIWRSFRGARSGSVTALWALVAMIGFFGYSMVDHPAAVDQVALAFWIFAGVAAAGTLAERPVPGMPDGGDGPARPPRDRHDEEIPAFAGSQRSGNVRVVRRVRRTPSEFDF